eukprot:m.57614 g.57614  ORF g.57614 m.57614 type:complete len:377 (+) comp12119_c0_seq4:402-1532(+)
MPPKSLGVMSSTMVKQIQFMCALGALESNYRREAMKEPELCELMRTQYEEHVDIFLTASHAPEPCEDWQSNGLHARYFKIARSWLQAECGGTMHSVTRDRLFLAGDTSASDEKLDGAKLLSRARECKRVCCNAYLPVLVQSLTPKSPDGLPSSGREWKDVIQLTKSKLTESTKCWLAFLAFSPTCKELNFAPALTIMPTTSAKDPEETSRADQRSKRKAENAAARSVSSASLDSLSAQHKTELHRAKLFAIHSQSHLTNLRVEQEKLQQWFLKPEDAEWMMEDDETREEFKSRLKVMLRNNVKQIKALMTENMSEIVSIATGTTIRPDEPDLPSDPAPGPALPQPSVSDLSPGPVNGILVPPVPVSNRRPGRGRRT